MERRAFLSALGSASLAARAVGAEASAATATAPVERALVLSGGGARGVYAAGAIGGMAATRGIRDGKPFSPYGVVCGTSIGALNGWFVATGQYSRLQDLWYSISAFRIMRLKPQFAAVRDDQSGLLDRLAAAIRLVTLTKNQAAVLRTEPALDWIASNVDPERPLLMPLVWAVTNLTTQRPEYFYRLSSPAQADPGSVIDALRLTLGPNTVVREATPEMLHRALFASAAIPLAFDPVEIPGLNGETNLYVDGGIASNSPVAIAHAVSNAADIILMDPPFEEEPHYEDAVAVAFGAYGTMQRKILDVEMRDVYFQSVGARAFASLTPEDRRRVTKDESLLATFMDSVPPTQLMFMRPQKTLPLGVASFNDEVGIGKAYRIGWIDATTRGFTPYTWETFEL